MQRFFAGILSALLLCGGAVAQDQTDKVESGYVLQTAGRLLFIDQGEQAQVRPGDLFQVVRQEVIRHPETGENLAGEVALGVVRVVEVFPRLSTAEVVDMVKGADLELIDKEARLGIIRIKKLLPEVEMAMMQQLQIAQMAKGGMAGPGTMGRMNPDGLVGKVSPEIRLGFGSKPVLRLPERTYQLISPTTTVGEHLVGSGVSLADSAFAGVSNVLLGTLADTLSVPQGLDSGASSLYTQFGLTYPLSERLTVLAHIGFGSRSEIAGGVRFYPGRLFGFLGSGFTPDGLVGEPVMSLMVGRGGQGASGLSLATKTQLTARTTLVADPVYRTVLDSVQRAGADTLYQADVTRILQKAAGDSLSALTKRSLGFAFTLKLPLTTHITLQGNMTRLGNIKEMGGGFIYYMRSIERAQMMNPDGMPRSLVFEVGGRYDSGTKVKTLDLNLVMPVSSTLTISGNVMSNLGSYTRVGVSIKSYLKGF